MDAAPAPLRATAPTTTGPSANQNGDHHDGKLIRDQVPDELAAGRVGPLT
ncbi:hypothetical protein AB0A94_13925 [Streptomyces sp. NPDC044984]